MINIIHALAPGYLVSCKGLCLKFGLCSVSFQIFIFFLSPVFNVLDPENDMENCKYLIRCVCKRVLCIISISESILCVGLCVFEYVCVPCEFKW